MPNSSNPVVQGPAYPASSAAFSTKSDEAKVLSYMWYIHVTVRVNAADRLWDRLAHLLGRGTATTPTTPAITPASPSYSPQFDLDGINNAGSSGDDGQNSTPGREGNSASATNEIGDLTDYLVLQFFSRPMLETLVNTAPIEEHTDGYARVLASIPAHFREEFCRRLYCLLFSKYILEWPQGIAVPEPAPGSIAAAAAATTDSAATASSTRPEATTASTSSETAVGEEKRKDEDEKEDEFMFDMDDILTYDEHDDIFDGENYERLVSPEPASPGYQSTLGPSSPWPDTPSLGYSPELSRAAYFGTVSAPLPIQYLGNCGRSISSNSRSREDGPARAAYAGAGAGAGAAGGIEAGAGAGAIHDARLLPSTSWHRRHPAAPAPPHSTTTPPQSRPASLLGSAHSRDQQQRASHTGSCCPCRVREAWSHGVGGQR